MLVLPRRGRYSGRLTFDPDSLFHTDDKGRRVVTEDEGKTWRYAVRSDLSHNARYEKKVAAFTATTEADPHHFAPTPDDLHVDGPLVDSDHVAATVTSHTEAYA